MIFISFGLFMLSFIFIGLLSTIKSKRTSEDYLLASYSEKPWLIALSAVATNNSGYMFIGVIGYTYVNGISSLWILLCIIIGDLCASFFVYKNLRIVSQKAKALSFPEALSKWSGEEYKIIRILSAVILILFLSVYAAAQLRAGGKALHVLFGWNNLIGSLIGTIIVIAYCASGGIRASIWTNTAQSFVMIFSMAVLFYMAINKIGGFADFINNLKTISPNYFSIYPVNQIDNKNLGLACFLFGWFFGGFGIIGQPHIMTSFMAMNKPESINKIRIYYYSWYIVFFLLTIGVGLASRILLPYYQGFDPELALPTLSQNILPEILVGFVLAGLFSATMSTADSQIICCAGAITNDLMPSKRNNYMVAKKSTIVVAIFAMIISVVDSQSVFSLVMLGWLALACSYSPLIIIYCFGGKMSEKLALISMITGFSSMMIWRYLGLGAIIYEAAPGIIFGLMPYIVSKIKCHILAKNL